MTPLLWLLLATCVLVWLPVPSRARAVARPMPMPLPVRVPSIPPQFIDLRDRRGTFGFAGSMYAEPMTTWPEERIYAA